MPKLTIRAIRYRRTDGRTYPNFNSLLKNSDTLQEVKEEIKFKPKHILGNILAIIMFFADYASDIWVIGNYNIF